MKNQLDFYKRFSEYNDISEISYIQGSNDSRTRGLLQVKERDSNISYEVNYIGEENSPYNLRINISNQAVAYISKKVSPIINVKVGEELEDKNKLFLSLGFFKVNFKDYDKVCYFPLFLMDITEHKEKIFKEARRSGSSSLSIDFSKELIINEDILKFFYDFSYEENGEKLQEYLPETLEDLVPENSRVSIETLLNYIYNFFQKKEKKGIDFEIVYPKIKSAASTAFMFFNKSNSFKVRSELEDIKNEDNKLIEEYLEYSQIENKSPDMDNSCWYGSLTKDFPLGKGQGIVLQENQKDKRIVPVVGGPGTGKTTLFLSVIANEITKRAISNIEDKKDHNNMILVTSTSNKAVENVYTDLKKGWKNGFCYIGGNAQNRANSALEVESFINLIKDSEVSPEKILKYEDNIKKIKNFMDTSKKDFLEVKENTKSLENIKSFNDLKERQDILIKKISFSTEEEIFNMNKNIDNILIKLSLLVNEDISFNRIEEILSNNMIMSQLEIINKKINHSNFLSKIVSNNDKEFDKLKDFGLNIEEGNFSIAYDLIMKLQKNIFPYRKCKEAIKNIEDISSIDKIITKYSKNEETFNKFIKEDNFGEYFRKNLFSLNYKLYIQSYLYLYEKMLEEKEEVIIALKYLTLESKDQFRYLMDNFGVTTKGLNKFLRLISLAYPVTTSTLSGLGGMFPGVFPNRTNTYKTVLADEAGMIASNAIIPALRRANRAVIVGDPKQLEAIVSTNEIFLDSLKSHYSKEFWNKYSPSKVSAFHRAAGTIEGGFKATGRGIVLDEHRRCSPQIANLFIDIAEYDGLKVCTPQPKTKEFKNIGEQGLMFFDIENPEKNGFNKVNQGEISVIHKLLDRLENAGYNLKKDIGIITPYKDQERELINTFAQRVNHNSSESKIGTIHKFQGVEYKIILFSCVASRDTDNLNFINLSPSLINVAVSRAKESFISVGDFDKLTKINSEENYIGRMSKYISKEGLYVKMKKD